MNTRRYRIIKILSLLFLASGFWCAAAPAGDAAAYVSAVKGTAYSFNTEGEVRQLQKGDRILTGEYISTGEKSRIKVSFFDKTIVTIGESATIQLNEYDFQEKDGKGSFRLKITDGFFRIIGGTITRKSPEKFISETPVATIGIRGSSYAGQMSKAGLRVFLESGKGIDVYNRHGSVALLRPGLGTVVSGKDVAPQTPRYFNATELNDILQQSSFEQGSASATSASIIKPGAVIDNRSVISNSVNIAVGRNNRADMGTIRIKDSEISGSVVNESKVSDAANMAIGKDNRAVMGTIGVE